MTQPIETTPVPESTTDPAQAVVEAAVTHPPVGPSGLIDRGSNTFQPPTFIYAGGSLGGRDVFECMDCGSAVVDDVQPVNRERHTAHHQDLHNLKIRLGAPR